MRFSIGTLRYARLCDEAKQIARGASWLVSSQAVDGTWGASPLDQIVSTCHATMALQAVGFNIDSLPLRSAVEFLCSEGVKRHNFGFWNSAPLLGIRGCEEAVEESLAAIRQRVISGASPHPDQSLAAYYLMAAQLAGLADDVGDIAGRLAEEVKEWSNWPKRADTTSHALASLLSYDQQILGEHERERAIDLIVDRGVTVDGDVSWEGRVSSTAYVLMNVVETDMMAEHDRLRPMLAKAVKYVLRAQAEDGGWPTEDPPYGGAGEIGRAYFTGLALRGAMAGISLSDSSILVQSQQSIYELENEKVQPCEQVAEIGALDAAQLPVVRNTRRWAKRLAYMGTVLLLVTLIVAQSVIYNGWSIVNLVRLALVIVVSICTFLGGVAAVVALVDRFRGSRNQ